MWPEKKWSSTHGEGKKRPTLSRFALTGCTNLPNFVFQLSKSKVQKCKDEMLRLSLEAARTAVVLSSAYGQNYGVNCRLPSLDLLKTYFPPGDSIDGSR